MNKISISDVIKIVNEEVIPADSVLMSDKGLIDYSFVTGESFPETVLQGEKIFAGGRIKGNAIELTVTQLPSQSYLTKLWDESSQEEETKISKLSDKIASWFTIVVLILAFGAGGHDHGQHLLTRLYGGLGRRTVGCRVWQTGGADRQRLDTFNRLVRRRGAGPATGC